MVILDLTYNDFERSDQGHMTLHGLYLRYNRIGIWLLLMVYRNPYGEQPLIHVLYLTYDDLDIAG